MEFPPSAILRLTMFVAQARGYGNAPPCRERRLPGRTSPSYLKIGWWPRPPSVVGACCFYWAWLQEQPGGASAALRRLVEQAEQNNAGIDRARKAQTATYRVMYALAGHVVGYEDALRALYSGDAERFETLVGCWPTDVAAYIRKLAAEVL